MKVSKIEEFLSGIIKIHDEHEGVKNIHLNYIHNYHTAHDPHLNRCWKKFCLIVFESPHLRTEE